MTWRDLFEELDALPGICEPSVDEWKAWPIIRYFLWGALREGLAGEHGILGRGELSRRQDRVSNAVRASWRALCATLHLLRERPKGEVLLLCGLRSVTTPEGERIDYLLDKLVHDLDCGRDAIVMDFSPEMSRPIPILMGGDPAYSALPLIFAGYLLSFPLRFLPSVRRATRELTKIVTPCLDVIPSRVFEALTRKHLALFLANKYIYTAILPRLKVQAIAMTSAGGKWGEVAAAKSLGISVLELQHGIIGPEEPEYNWPGSFMTIKSAIPTPTRVLVFGEIWRGILLKNGFWGESEIIVVGSALIDRFRVAKNNIRKNSHRSRKRILFVSQDPCRPHALEFWEHFLADAQAGKIDCVEVLIKLHPLEFKHRKKYQDLADRYKGLCSLVSEEESVQNSALQVDYVVGYYSASLLESVALGVPTYSITNISSDSEGLGSGISSVTPLPGLREIVPHIGSPEELMEIVSRLSPGTLAYSQQVSRCLEYGFSLFGTNFLTNVQREIRMVSGRFA